MKSNKKISALVTKINKPLIHQLNWSVIELYDEIFRSNYYYE